MQESIESIGEFVVSRGEAAELLEAIEKSLDEVSCFVATPVDRALGFPVAARRNDSLGPRRLDGGDRPVAVVALVGDDRFSWDALNQSCSLGDIGYLPRRQDEANGITQCIDTGMDLGGQTSPRTPDRYRFFGCAGRVLVGADNRGVDEQFFKVGIVLERPGNTMPNTVLFPAGKTDIYRMPVAQFFRQVAPRARQSSRHGRSTSPPLRLPHTDFGTRPKYRENAALKLAGCAYPTA